MSLLRFSALDIGCKGCSGADAADVEGASSAVDDDVNSSSVAAGDVDDLDSSLLVYQVVV